MKVVLGDGSVDYPKFASYNRMVVSVSTLARLMSLGLGCSCVSYWERIFLSGVDKG